MNGDRWSDEEHSRLLALRQSCGSAREISERMPGRTYKAVIARLHIFGLSYPMPSGAEWTAGRVSTLKLMWAAGESTSKIGEAIGMTKNAVIGKAHRLGLSKRPSPIKRRDNVIEVEFRGCEWPEGEKPYTFCGKKRVHGKPYCEAHCKRAYLPIPPRVRKKANPFEFMGDVALGKKARR